MIGDVIRITASFLSSTDELRQWVYHYVQTVGGTSVYLDLLTAVLDRLQTAWFLIDQTVELNTQGSTIALALYDSVLNQWDTLATLPSTGLVGTTLSTEAPGNVAPYVTFFTNIGRSSGHKKFFDNAENLFDGDVLVAGFITDLAAFAAVLDNALTESGNTWKPGNFTQATQTFTQWLGSSIGVGAVTGSEYRRLTGRGK